MFEELESKIYGDDLQVKDVIETALQLDVGMYDHLPNEMRNPGIAGLFVYRLLADFLHQHETKLSKYVVSFLKKIDEVSLTCIKKIEKDATQAFIKKDINTLMEYDGGFVKQPIAKEEIDPIIEKLGHLRNNNGLFEGKLVYRKSDGRFFAMINSDFINIANNKFGGNKPSAYIDKQMNVPYKAHITLNDGMDKEQGEKIFANLKEEFGMATEPITSDPDIVCLNKLIEFDIISADRGIGKTNSRMQSTSQFRVDSDQIGELDKKYGLKYTLTNYTNHISFSEVTRPAYPGLKDKELVFGLINKEGISAQLLRVLGVKEPSLEPSNITVTNVIVKQPYIS
jgi:hypothetical protein